MRTNCIGIKKSLQERFLKKIQIAKSALYKEKLATRVKIHIILFHYLIFQFSN